MDTRRLSLGIGEDRHATSLRRLKGYRVWLAKANNGRLCLFIFINDL